MENKLFFGDNLEVLRDHVPDDSVDLIYIDPPFNSNRNYFVLFKDRTGKASAAQEAAFEDTWTWTEDSEATYKELVARNPNRDLATTTESLRQFLKETPMMAYLTAMAIRLIEIHRVLKPTGSFYLHCDPTASHYLKLLLDTVFGPRNYRNEIVWERTSSHNDSKKWMQVHDTLFYYCKSSQYTWNAEYLGHDPSYVKEFYRYSDERGVFRLDHIIRSASMGPRPNLAYEYSGYTPDWGWRVVREKLEKLDADNRIYRSGTGRPYIKRYLAEQTGTPIKSVITDIHPVSAVGKERLGYPTQKPLALLERIISVSSNPGDCVLDCYCGCGTTVTAAHRLGRKWIGIDITAVSVAIIKSRLENSFDDLKGKVQVEGFPQDAESARQLFEIDPYRFQAWACTLIDAYPLTKKGADAGIDGWLNFFDLDDTSQRAVVQVKGGKVQLGQIRDFCHVVQREKAAIGFFICFGDVTDPMRKEAIKEGYWTDVGRHDYPKVQILTIADLFAGTARARYPSQHGKSMLGFKASHQERAGQQKELFDDD